MCAMGGMNVAGSMLRPASYLEELCEMGHLHDSILTGYVMRLRSAQPLTVTQVRTALIHLRRQVPCLRLCFATDAGNTWLQESTNDTIDLEMVNHNAVDEVLAIMSRYRYRSRTGPLWCVKVLAPHSSNDPAMETGETISRPDTGLGTPSPPGSDDDENKLLPRPDSGLATHPSERYDCEPLMPGEVIGVSLRDPHRCIILPGPAPFPDAGLGPERHHAPLPGAVGGYVGGAEGGNVLPFVPDDGAGPSGYGGHAEQREEEYASGSGETSRDISPTEDPSAPMEFDEETPSYSTEAATERSDEQELDYLMSEYVSEEDLGAAAARAAATASAPPDPGSSRSSLVGTSSSASPAFLDTGSSISSSPCREPSPPSMEAQGIIAESFDTISNVVVGIHQGIADGFSAMRICGRFVKLLNDAVGGVEIDDSVPLEDNSVAELREMVASRVMALSDLVKRGELRAAMEERNNWISNMTGVFGEQGQIGGPGGRGGRRVRHRTSHEAIAFDSIATTRFLEKCKIEGVGVLAAFSALANISLMDILTARDVHKKTYNFFSGHGVDMRRYSGAVGSAYLMGCLVAPVHIGTPTPLHAADKFWNFARVIESDLKRTVEEDQALMELAIMELYPPTMSDYNELFREPLPQMKDYYTVFLDDVTPLITEGGPHVTVEYVESTMSRHKLGYACCHVLHIFRGALCITLNFSSRYLSTDMAKEYMSNIFRRFNEVV